MSYNTQEMGEIRVSSKIDRTALERRTLTCLSELNMSPALKSEQKEAISAQVLERIYLTCCQMALGKA